MTMTAMQQQDQLIARTVNYHLVTLLQLPRKQGEAHTVYQEPSGDLGLGLHAQPLVEKVPG